MIRLALHLGLVGATVWVSTPRSVRADPVPSADNRQVAKEYVDAGLAAQQVKDYDTAITMYQKAYELIPHPILIFDIAQAYRLAGRLDDARREYKRYLSIDPSGSQSKTVRDLIAEIEAKVRTGSSPPSRDPGGPPGTAASVVVSGDTTADDTEVPPRGVPAVDGGRVAVSPANPPRTFGPAEMREVSPGRKLRIIGLAFGGAGVAALTIGSGAGAYALYLSSVVHSESDPRDADGRHAQTISRAGFVAGGVLLAAGAVLYWRGYSRDRAVVAPTKSDGSVGVTVIGVWP